MMKTQHVLKAVIGAAMISGAAVAQQPPAGPGAQCPMGGPCVMRDQRAPQGMQQRAPQGMQQRGAQGMQRGPQGMMGGGRGPGSQMGEKPCLNPERLKAAGVKEEQLTALRAFKDQQELKRIELKAEVDKAELLLKQVMSNENADEKAAFEAFDRLSKARTDAARQGISAKFKVREILGPEVARKLCEMGPPPGARPRGPGGPGGPRGPGAQGGRPAGVPDQR